MNAPDHVVADQTEAITLLSDPRTHGGQKVTRIDTHGAIVILAGQNAYKMKRAVLFPYMDFSTLERRQKACEAEFAINRQWAPLLYLGVEAIRRTDFGTLTLGGAGDCVEWILVMRRFEQSMLFDRMTTESRLDAALVTRLADIILQWHQSSASTPRFGGAHGIAEVLALNERGLRETDLFVRDKVAALAESGRAALARLRPLLEARREAGFVRHCHGDLHLGNICLFEGQPTLFDAIEFNDSISHIDVLYDLAFLLMDFEHRQRGDLGNLLFNRYFSEAFRQGNLGTLSGLALLPLFLSCRAGAGVRAQVKASASTQSARPTKKVIVELGDYLDLALGYLRPSAPRLVAIGGLSGSGKSMAARTLAPALGPRPGALHLRSDVIRKHLFGKDELERLGPECYTTEITARVYRVIRERAAQALAAGHAVIADAVHATAEERGAIEQVALEAGVRFDGIWLDAPIATLESRIAKRTADASDATSEIVRQQLCFELGEISWSRVNSAGPREATSLEMRSLLCLG